MQEKSSSFGHCSINIKAGRSSHYQLFRDDLVMLEPIRRAWWVTSSYSPANHGCHYVVYCDDLAFNGKRWIIAVRKACSMAALDKRARQKLLVYATSNRRHLLPQLMKTMWAFIMGKLMKSIRMRRLMKPCRCLDRTELWLSFHPDDPACVFGYLLRIIWRKQVCPLMKQKPLPCALPVNAVDVLGAWRINLVGILLA